MAMTAQQIAAAAREAGFTGEALVTIVAIAFAESGGDPRAHGDRDNPRPGCGSYGLTQVNSCPTRDAPGHPRWGGQPSALFDPVTNMRSAFAISNGGKTFQPWTTYRTGAYRAHLAKARVEGTEGASPAGSTLDGSTLDLDIAGIPIARDGQPTGPLGALAAFDTLARLLTDPATWKRVLGVVVGVVLLILGVALVRADLTVRTFT